MCVCVEERERERILCECEKERKKREKERLFFQLMRNNFKVKKKLIFINIQSVKTHEDHVSKKKEKK